MDMKKRISRAGVRVNEFASLCGVTRAAVYKWFGGANVGELRAGRVEKLLAALDLAVERKELPLVRPRVRTVEGAHQLAAIKTILLKNLKTLSEQ